MSVEKAVGGKWRAGRLECGPIEERGKNVGVGRDAAHCYRRGCPLLLSNGIEDACSADTDTGDGVVTRHEVVLEQGECVLGARRRGRARQKRERETRGEPQAWHVLAVRGDPRL